MRRVILSVVVSAALVAVPAAAHAAGVDVTRTVVLDDASGYCNAGPDSGTPTAKSVAIVRISGTSITAHLRLRDMLPGVSYAVALVQIPSGANCPPPVDSVVLTTDAHGDAEAVVTDTIEAGQVGVYVLLESFGAQPPLATRVIPLT